MDRLRRRANAPITPKPASSMAKVSGSGTGVMAASAGAVVTVPFRDVIEISPYPPVKFALVVPEICRL